MATIKPRRGTSYPASGLSQNELAVDTTNRRIYLGSAGGSGITVASHIIDYVVSLNGSTGAITNVARTNQGNTFSVQQVFTAGISAATGSNVLEIIATTDGCGLRIARAASGAGSRVGGIRLGRSTTLSDNSYIESSAGTLKFFNGISGTNETPGTNMLQLSTANAVFGVPIDGATFSSTAGRITVQRSGAGVGGESAVVRIVGTDALNNPYNSDIRANASAAADTTHTLPSTTGTLLNTASSYVSGICGATGAVILSAGSNMTITKSGNTFTFASGGLSWTAVTADQTMAVDTGYLANKSSGTLTLTLPTTSAVGKTLRVSGMQNTWRIAQNASQKIHFGKTTTTTGVGGYLENSNAKDAVELVCAVADLEWNVISSIGNITIV